MGHFFCFSFVLLAAVRTCPGMDDLLPEGQRAAVWQYVHPEGLEATIYLLLLLLACLLACSFACAVACSFACAVACSFACAVACCSSIQAQVDMVKVVFGLSGRVVLEVEASHTIDSIKDKIHVKEGFLPSQQRLAYCEEHSAYVLVVLGVGIVPCGSLDEDGLNLMLELLAEQPAYPYTGCDVNPGGKLWALCRLYYLGELDAPLVRQQWCSFRAWFNTLPESSPSWGYLEECIIIVEKDLKKCGVNLAEA